MVRTPERWAVAVRRRDGSIHAESHDLPQRTSRLASTLLRGPMALADSVSIGLQALRISLREAVGEAPTSAQMAATGGMAMVTVLAVFLVAPGVLVAGLDGAVAHAVEASSRAAMLLCYLVLVGRSASTRRLFGYHGAEHKAIAAFESSGRIPAEDAARAASPIHVRCGTDFVAIVVVAAGVVFSFAPRAPWWSAAAWRVGLMPVVVVVAYEVMRAAARYPGDWWARALTWPGRALQRITTREPDQGQLEVALVALRRALT